MRGVGKSSIELLRHTPFRRQFLASALSMIGSALTPVALAIGVLQVTGSPTQLGLVLAAYTLPQVAFVVVGGVWADRLPRQRVMMWADAVRVVTQVTFGLLLIAGTTPLWAMMTLQAFCGAASALFMPASVGLVAETSPSGRRQEANAMLSLVGNLTGTLVPVLAAALVITVGAGWALVIDGFTFAGSLYFLSRLQVPDRDPSSEEEPNFVRELVDGWREVSRRSWVWSSIVYFMIFNITFAAFQVLGPAALVQGDSGAISWGLVVGALGLGQVLGSALALAWRPQRPLFVGRLLMLLGAPVLVFLATDAPLVALVAGALLCGLAISFPDTLWDAALQEHIHGSALARVSSFDFLGSFLLRPVGLGLVAVLAGSLGTSRTLWLGAAVMTGATLLSFLDPVMRSLTRAPEVATVAEDA